MPPKHWLSRRHPLSIILWPISVIFGILRWVRTKFYDWSWFKTHNLPVPVVVVGNVLAGGVGKTPIVIGLVQRLQMMGYKPGVVSRGYGRKSKECLLVQTTSTSDLVGDEPLMIARILNIPVAVAPKRVQAAEALLAQHPECNVILSDDGLQHLALGRDLEIVIFDERGTGNNWLLPAGPLREPWPRKARAATRLTLDNVPRTLANFVTGSDGHPHLLTSIEGKKLHAVAGIAKPEDFFAMLRTAGLILVSTKGYADHHTFADFNPALQPEGIWLCTEKDAVKLWAMYPQVANRIFAAPIAINLDPTFLAVFDATIQALTSRQ